MLLSFYVIIYTTITSNINNNSYNKINNSFLINIKYINNNYNYN